MSFRAENGPAQREVGPPLEEAHPNPGVTTQCKRKVSKKNPPKNPKFKSAREVPEPEGNHSDDVEAQTLRSQLQKAEARAKQLQEMLKTSNTPTSMG